MSLHFAPAEIPSNARVTAVNPYAEAVAACVTNGGALSFLIPGQHPAPNDKGVESNSEITAALRLLGLAGAPLNVTVRKRVENTDKGAKVTFWTVERIVHTPHAPRGTAAPVEDAPVVASVVKVHSK